MYLILANSTENHILSLRLENIDEALEDFRNLGAHLSQFGIKMIERTDMSRAHTDFTFRIGKTLNASELLRWPTPWDDLTHFPKVSNNDHIGRPPALTRLEVMHVEEMLQGQQATLKEIAYKMRCSVRTIRRIHDGKHTYSSRRPK